MAFKPNKWGAAALGFFFQPLGLMYAGRLGWAGVYFLVAVAIGGVSLFYLQRIPYVAEGVQLAFVLVSAIHAYRLASQYPEDRPRPGYSRWYGLVGTLLGLLVVSMGVRSFLLEPFRAPSSSMAPGIESGSYLIVQKWGYGHYGTFGLAFFQGAVTAPLSRGDIIVFDFPLNRSVQYVKRLIGLPGDKVTLRDKRLFINDQEVPRRRVENYFHSDLAFYSPRYVESLGGVEYSVIMEDDMPPVIPGAVFPLAENCVFDASGMTCNVPPGHYFTLGDNRDNSADSRVWGFVPADHVLGKVIRVLP
jgi:signal peptidase I